MAELITELSEGWEEAWSGESICWTCAEAYADKCAYFDRSPDCTWEQKLSVPSKVAVRLIQSAAPRKDGSLPPPVPFYKVLECPDHCLSERAIKAEGETGKGSEPPPPPAPVLSIPVPTKGLCPLCGEPMKNDIGGYCSKLCRIMSAGIKRAMVVS